MDGPHLSGHPVPPLGGAAEQAGCAPVSRAVTAGEAFMQAITAGFTPPSVRALTRDELQRRQEAAGWALYRALDRVRRMPTSRPPTAEQMLAAALVYAAHGVPVFPTEPGGKRPATIHGFRDAMTRDEIARDRWDRRHGSRNIAMPTGWPFADVMDVDQRRDGHGWAAYHRLKEAGLLAGAFALIRTRSAGAHVYLAGTRQRCSKLKGHRVDFKGEGGYVLLPPSFVHGEDGISGAYEVAELRAPTGSQLDWEAAKRLLTPQPPVRRVWVGRGGRVDHLPEWLAEQPEGNRNAALHWAACRAAEAGDQAVLAELVGAAVQAGLSEEEARRTVASAERTVSGG